MTYDQLVCKMSSIAFALKYSSSGNNDKLCNNILVGIQDKKLKNIATDQYAEGMNFAYEECKNVVIKILNS